MKDPKYDYIAIGLPLPVTVVGALGGLLNKAWPGATIITNPYAAGVPADVIRTLPSNLDPYMLVRIDRQAPKRVSKKAAQEVIEASGIPEDPDRDVLLTKSIDSEGGFSLSAPEQLMHALAPIIEAILTDHAGPNYVEIPVKHPEHGVALLTVSRSKGQTPHALLLREKEEAERLRALLDQHGIAH